MKMQILDLLFLDLYFNSVDIKLLRNWSSFT